MPRDTKSGIDWQQSLLSSGKGLFFPFYGRGEVSLDLEEWWWTRERAAGKKNKSKTHWGWDEEREIMRRLEKEARVGIFQHNSFIDYNKHLPPKILF